METPGALIDRLALAPHPEGGWYRETWRAAATDTGGGRSLATAILFLLEAGQRSHWHTVDAEELWLWHRGSPLTLLTAPADAGPTTAVRLGPDILAGETVQHLIPAGHWQAAEATESWTLASCVVAPAFAFAGFRLAPAGWAPAE